MFANVSPTCSPCGHVMQPVGPRTLHERQIGGEPVAFWEGYEYACPACSTRVVQVAATITSRLPVGSVGYARIEAEREQRAATPALRIVGAEHLPVTVARDSSRIGAPAPLSQRQRAAQIVQAFWETDGADPLAALDAIAQALGVDVPAALHARAEAVLDQADPLVTARATRQADVAALSDEQLATEIAELLALEADAIDYEDLLTEKQYAWLHACQAERERRAAQAVSK